ncbi:MAG: toxin-antitoxin system HicB family antitoxin [Campylobacterales bacterium]
MNIALRLPDSLGKELKTFSQKESVSMNQFIATAVAEKMATIQTYDYLAERAKRGDLGHLKQMLGRVGDADPDEADRFK